MKRQVGGSRVVGAAATGPALLVRTVCVPIRARRRVGHNQRRALAFPVERTPAGSTAYWARQPAAASGMTVPSLYRLLRSLAGVRGAYAQPDELEADLPLVIEALGIEL